MINKYSSVDSKTLLHMMEDKRLLSPVIDELCTRLERHESERQEIEDLEERFNEIERAFAGEYVKDCNLGQLPRENFDKFLQALANAKTRNAVIANILQCDLNDMDDEEVEAEEFFNQLASAKSVTCSVCEAKI